MSSDDEQSVSRDGIHRPSAAWTFTVPLECQERCDGGWWMVGRGHPGDYHLKPEKMLSHELRANAGTNARSALDQSTIPNRRPLWEGEDDISIRWTSRLADEKSLFPARPDTASGLPTLQEQGLTAGSAYLSYLSYLIYLDSNPPRRSPWLSELFVPRSGTIVA